MNSMIEYLNNNGIPPFPSGSSFNSLFIRNLINYLKERKIDNLECQIVNAALNSAILSPQIEPTSQLNYFQEPQQQLLLLPSNSPLQINENSNNNNVVGLSLEHLVKVLVETVREVTGTRNIISNKNEREGNEEISITRDETAAQILERRRKQNNAAAARYRRRQRKVENTMQQELALLERRNYELRTSIANLRAEIEAENSLLKAIQSGKNK
uniref:BZIP domain-containing protein n=1 Tax=Meloidogyne enterolobii TaxID=390850 RepID=A0A6V7WBC5_MELEN|nr:unnamed protein product [Meloidogyne enterolobii]